MSDIKNLVRENIRGFAPYASARDTFEIGENSNLVLLDANENPFVDNFVEDENSKNNLNQITLNRYPDPKQKLLRAKISREFGVDFEQVICGNGSDELIDLLVRIFCEPKQDSILVCPITFGVYKVCAGVQDVAVENVELIEEQDDFQLDVEKIVTSEAKICFIPQPAAPTGGAFKHADLLEILEKFRGIIVIDEAYMDFYGESFINEINNFKNLVVLRTFSKYWGMAGARVGMAFANIEIINYLMAVKAPYNVNVFSQKKAIEAIENLKLKEQQKQIILEERVKFREFLEAQNWVLKIYNSVTNFIFFETDLRDEIYDKCVASQIIVRKFGYDNRKFLRITIGNKDENLKLMKVLGKI
jgi:histidinol-phosphate aminotransferase